MDLIDQFIVRYRREFDFYDRAGRLVAQQLEGRLQASGIRAMVTSRAKNPRRLEAKLRQRSSNKTYSDIDSIYADIVNLAGVRVALYFPGERKEADKIIREQFSLTSDPKVFTGTYNPTHEKRFSGYWASHYRVQLRETMLPEVDRRYIDARVEIQAASVLMHAWAEVEHDLVYKPLQGNLSEDELAILDELNGMVLAGEIALERLQRAAEVRVKGGGTKFDNHYDLASFLLEAVRPLLQGSSVEPTLGDVELLFRFLQKLGVDSADGLRDYIGGLTPDTERRPVAQQITDQILAAAKDRYDVYANVRADSPQKDSGGSTDSSEEERIDVRQHHAALGFFLTQWITFERFLRELAESRKIDPHRAAIPSPSILRRLEVFDSNQLGEIEQIRRIRNYLVHGIEVPSPEFIQQTATTLQQILNKLAGDKRQDVREAALRALGLDNPDQK